MRSRAARRPKPSGWTNVERFTCLVDDMWPTIDWQCRTRRHEQRTRRDDANAERQVAWINEMDHHAVALFSSRLIALPFIRAIEYIARAIATDSLRSEQPRARCPAAMALTRSRRTTARAPAGSSRFRCTRSLST